MISPDRPHFADHLEHLSVLRSAALKAAEPQAAVRRFLVPADFAFAERVFVVGTGKAGVAMGRAAAEILGEHLAAGVMAVPQAAPPAGRLEFIQGGHPDPSTGSLAAGQAAARLLEQATERDLVLALISGGGSALLELPAPGLELADLQAVNTLLLRSGAAIQEVNTVRSRLSQLKGGGLARLAQPAPVLGLILSDVVGSPLGIIASGPTVPSALTAADALAVIERYGLAPHLPPAVMNHLQHPLSQATRSEKRAEIWDARVTLSPAHPKFRELTAPGYEHSARVRNRLIGSNRQAAEAAVTAAVELGFEALFLGDDWQGEAREAGRRFAEQVTSPPTPPPAGAPLPPLPGSEPGRGGRGRGWGVRAYIAGGETTVTVRGRGKGGRNQEAALAAALAVEGQPGVVISTFATDGVDGPTDAAGATVTGQTVARARALGLDPQRYLDDNDSYTFFAALSDLVLTGPTGTNVNDLIFALTYFEE